MEKEEEGSVSEPSKRGSDVVISPSFPMERCFHQEGQGSASIQAQCS